MVALDFSVVLIAPQNDLFSSYRLSSQPRPRGDTLGNSSFKISSCARAYVRIINKKTKGTLSWEYNEVYKLKTNHTSFFHLKPKLHQVSSFESGMCACHGNNLSFFHQEVVGSVATCQTWDAVKYLRRLSALIWGGRGRGEEGGGGWGRRELLTKTCKTSFPQFVSRGKFLFAFPFSPQWIHDCAEVSSQLTRR